MFQYDILQSVFLSRVGFRQTEDECYPKIHPSLLAGMHKVPATAEVGSLLQNEIVYDACDVFVHTPAKRAAIAAWNNATSYQVGERVRYTVGTHEYIFHSLQSNNLNNTPAWNSQYWETDLSAFYRRIHEESCRDALSQVVVEDHTNVNRMWVKEFGPIYDARTGIQTHERDESRSFHCVEIVLKPIRNLATLVERVGVLFHDPQTVRFYVYHSSQPLPIAEFNVVISNTDAGNFVWKDILILNSDAPKLMLTYMSDSVNSGGAYYIGFYTDDVQGDFGEFDAWLKMTASYPYQRISSKKLVSSTGINLPDVGYYLEANTSSERTSLNLQITTQLDYTYNVRQAPQMFDKYLQYDMAIRILNVMRSSSRKNTPKANIDDKVLSVLLSSSESIIGGDTKVYRKGLYALRETHAKLLHIDLAYNGSSPFVTRHI